MVSCFPRLLPEMEPGPISPMFKGKGLGISSLNPLNQLLSLNPSNLVTSEPSISPAAPTVLPPAVRYKVATQRARIDQNGIERAQPPEALYLYTLQVDPKGRGIGRPPEILSDPRLGEKVGRR